MKSGLAEGEGIVLTATAATQDTAPAPVKPVLRVSGVRKSFDSGETAVHALREVDLTVMPGEYVAIMGASGSGKSALLDILGCLDTPAGSGTCSTGSRSAS